MRDMALLPAGELEYRANVGGDLIEHEVVQTFVAICETKPNILPNPDEVMAYKWVDPITLERLISTAPDQYTVMFRAYIVVAKTQSFFLTVSDYIAYSWAKIFFHSLRYL